MIRSYWAIALVALALACRETQVPTLELDTTANIPEVFGEGLVSTNLYERDIALAPDGDELIFTRGNYAQTLRCLVSVKRENGDWGKAEVLPFSGEYNDIEPFYAPDGNALFFASNRPLDTLKAPERNDYNIWYVSRDETGWGKPVALDSVINKEGDEFYPSVTRNGSLYFTAQRDGGPGREDIYVSRRSNGHYITAVALDSAINTGAYEFNAYVGPEEDLIVFSSYGRADDLGGGDLYYSVRNKAGNWETAKNMGPLVNSGALDYCPFIDFTRNTFYFTSTRAMENPGRINSVEDLQRRADGIYNGMGNIFCMRTEALDLSQAANE